MNNYIALAVFAVVAALGLATAMLVVPSIPQAFAQGGPPGGQEDNRLKACGHSRAVPFCPPT